MFKRLKQKIRKPNHNYHLRHKRRAEGFLSNLEEAQGKTDPYLFDLSDEYAKEVLGWEGFSPWLRYYSAFCGEFKEGWIPENYYGKVVLPAVKAKYGDVSALNGLNKAIFPESSFPDVAYLINGVFTDHRYRLVSVEDIKSVLFEECDRVVFKLDTSYQGKDVYIYDESSFDIEKVKGLGSGVFQPFIKQHVFFNQFNSPALATIRITTAVDGNGNISARGSHLRLGAEGDSHVKTATQTRIAVNLETGQLHEKAYCPEWLVLQNSDLFKGLSIPLYSNCVDAVVAHHKKVPFVQCIGWDVALDEDGQVKILEWNGDHNGIAFHEVEQGPCFADLGWEKLWKETGYFEKKK